jgi:hypothetical protein
MKTASNVSRRTLLAASLGLPAAATAAALVMWRQRRSADALPPPMPKNESERRVSMSLPITTAPSGPEA